MRINIAIDGPSAAGKSSVSDILAEKLGYTHLDTGAMYRSVAYLAYKHDVETDDEDKVASLILNNRFEFKSDGQVLLNGEDISEAIRKEEISMAASNVSKNPKVREALVAMQQNIAKDKGYILDGRDIGTVVLKDAEVKIYLTASAEDRALRRYEQNKAKGMEADYEKILKEIKIRDHQDMNRSFSPLKKADDAYEIDSSKLTIEEVVAKIMDIVAKKI